MTVSASPARTRTLRRHGTRAVRLGLPLLAVGAGMAYFAVWRGLDHTGDLLLVVAALFAVLGLGVLAIGVFAVSVLLEGWFKTHMPGRGRARRRRPERTDQHARTAPPPSAHAHEPPPSPPPGGPRIF